MFQKMVIFSFVLALVVFGFYLLLDGDWGLVLKTSRDVFGVKRELKPELEIYLEENNFDPETLFKKDSDPPKIFFEKLPISVSEDKGEKNIYPTAAANIFISEILYDATGNDEGKEFIELYNAGDRDIDLSGWSLKKDGATFVSVGSKSADKKIIKSKGFFLIGLNDYVGVPSADVTRNFSLPNTEAKIELYGADGASADSMGYNNSVGEGESYERVSWSDSQFLPQTVPSPRNSGQ